MMLDLHEGILGEFSERACHEVDWRETRSFSLVRRSRSKLDSVSRSAPKLPKPPRPAARTREEANAARAQQRAAEDADLKRARWRAESKAKRERVAREIRALRAARAHVK